MAIPIILSMLALVALCGAGTILYIILYSVGIECSAWLLVCSIIVIHTAMTALLFMPSKIERLEKKIKKLQKNT